MQFGHGVHECGCGCKKREAKEPPKVRSGIDIKSIPISMAHLSPEGWATYNRRVSSTYSLLTTKERFVASKNELEPGESVVMGFNCMILGCVVPHHRIEEATDRLIKEFDRLVLGGIVKSVLSQMAWIELAHPKTHDFMMYELMERVAPDRVRGIPKPVVEEYDRHAVFMMVHGDWKNSLEEISSFLAPEGAMLKELPIDKEFKLHL